MGIRRLLTWRELKKVSPQWKSMPLVKLMCSDSMDLACLPIAVSFILLFDK